MKHANKRESDMELYRKAISQELKEEVLLLQLAEECNELSQAAIKYVRDKEGTNPVKPDITIGQLIHNITEEMSDVMNVIEVLSAYEWEIDRTIMYEKLKRWSDRLGLYIVDTTEENKEGE